MKIIKKEIKIIGQDNDFNLEITNVKENGKILKITEPLTAEELKFSLDQREATLKATINNINKARDELKLYTKPNNIDGLYEMFKMLMNLTPERKDELNTGIMNLEKDVEHYNTELKELRDAYKRAKNWLRNNKPDLVKDDKENTE